MSLFWTDAVAKQQIQTTRVQHESTKCNKWWLKTLLHYISTPKQRIFETVSQDIHTAVWRTEDWPCKVL